MIFSELNNDNDQFNTFVSYRLKKMTTTAGCQRPNSAAASSVIKGPLGLSINQLETIHALVGLRDGKRKRVKSSKPINTSVQLREPTGTAEEPLSDEAKSEPSTSEDFCFIYPTDIEYLTNYLLLLFAQVKKGVMDDDDRAKANRSTSLLNYGFRCRHCGGRERVSRL